ncbi:MAG: hypothetical protein LQ337_000558 [Flavoplaca oasis]|nr:MAG: hypothetical protein LQ337_000558 [Flavoplaca oasis]
MLPNRPQNSTTTPLSVQKDIYSPQPVSQLSIRDSERSPISTPTTIKRAAANSGKKRKTPDLSRCTPSSSHCEKMSAIFEDAGRTLSMPSAPRPLQANARRLRMPFSTTSSPKRLLVKANMSEGSKHNGVSLGKENQPPPRKGGSSSRTPPQSVNCMPSGNQSRGHANRPSDQIAVGGCYPVIEYLKREPPSSDFNRPTENDNMEKSTSLEQVVYPDLTLSQPIPVHPQLRMETEQNDFGGTTSDIETWLSQIANNNTSEPIHRPDGFHVPRNGSESPLQIGTPSRTDLSHMPPIPGEGSIRQALTQFPHPLTPSRHLNAPPKRKAHRLSQTEDGSLANPNNEQFDIYADEFSDEMIELSPTVEKYRKGRRPKRERCISYWDHDVLPGLSGRIGASREKDSHRQPLQELPELMGAKGFVDGVEHADFNFNVHLHPCDV